MTEFWPFVRVLILIIAAGALMKNKDPFLRFVTLLYGCYVFFIDGLAVLSKPIPATLVSQYMGISLGVLLLYFASNEENWNGFKRPISLMLTGADGTYRAVRMVVFILLPLFAGFQTYSRLKPRTEAPPPFRTVHPANPESISFRGTTMDLTTQTNPLREEGNFAEHLAVGKKVYYERCFFCHGDTWEGEGHFAEGFVPAPAKFTGDGTLAILTEGYVFWRIAKGGPGLPREATPWNSAMPAWEDRLTANEIWAVTMYLYDAIGKEPRAVGHAGAEEGGH